jgi:3-phytase
MNKIKSLDNFKPANLKKNFLNLIILILIGFLITFCRSQKKDRMEIPSSRYISAQTETKPVPRDSPNDAADDPAIWINNLKPDESLIIGTDKMGGLAVYDLSGNELHYYNTGKVNNIDIRYGFPLLTDTIDLLAASNRTDHTVDLYKIIPNGTLEIIHKNQLKSQLRDEVYGLCMYKSKISGKFFVFINSKDGGVEQWELSSGNNKISGKPVRNLKLDTQVEGMVADDENALLYVGEEDKGIWRFSAEPDSSEHRELLPLSTENDNLFIKYDLEGLAIYNYSGRDGYLIASSQGNNSYAVFERKPPNQYIGSFKIGDGQATDGTQETDGIDVTSAPLGINFPSGLFVTQDGDNVDNGVTNSQNFKLIRWDSIAVRFNPPLRF